MLFVMFQMNDTLIPKEHWPKERPINFERTIVEESTYSHNSKFGVKKKAKKNLWMFIH